jgi:hypothetical protein
VFVQCRCDLGYSPPLKELRFLVRLAYYLDCCGHYHTRDCSVDGLSRFGIHRGRNT